MLMRRVAQTVELLLHLSTGRNLGKRTSDVYSGYLGMVASSALENVCWGGLARPSLLCDVTDPIHRNNNPAISTGCFKTATCGRSSAEHNVSSSSHQQLYTSHYPTRSHQIPGNTPHAIINSNWCMGRGLVERLHVARAFHHL